MDQPKIPMGEVLAGFRDVFSDLNPAIEIAEPNEKLAEEVYKTLPKEIYDPLIHSANKDSILAVLRCDDCWRTHHDAVLAACKILRQAILARVAYLAALKNTIASEVDQRTEILNQATQATHGGSISQRRLRNHQDWLTYLSNFPSLVSDAVKHANWLKLLETEYRNAEELWLAFWALHARGVPAPAERIRTDHDHRPRLSIHQGLAYVGYEGISSHNRRRLFLHERIIQDREVMARLYADPPEWMDSKHQHTDKSVTEEDDDDDDETGGSEL